MGLELAMEALLETGFVVDGDPGALGKFFGEPAESGIEAEVVQDDRAQELGEFADVCDGFVNEMKVVSAQSFGV